MDGLASGRAEHLGQPHQRDGVEGWLVRREDGGVVRKSERTARRRAGGVGGASLSGLSALSGSGSCLSGSGGCIKNRSSMFGPPAI